MAKLHQVVATLTGVKEDVNKRTAPLFHSLKKGELFAGISQHYRPVEEGGITLPDDDAEVQVTVDDVLEGLSKPLAKLFDLLNTIENTNQNAAADIVVDGTTIATDVPVTFLMQFEKYLQREVLGALKILPVLDPATKWEPSASGRTGIYQSPQFSTFRTKKVQRPVVLVAPTKEFPGQAAMVTEDVIDGYWDKVKFSGAVPASRKEELLERCQALIEAVQKARETANQADIVDAPIGRAIFDYLFATQTPAHVMGG